MDDICWPARLENTFKVSMILYEYKFLLNILAVGIALKGPTSEQNQRANRVKCSCQARLAIAKMMLRTMMIVTVLVVLWSTL